MSSNEWLGVGLYCVSLACIIFMAPASMLTGTYLHAAPIGLFVVAMLIFGAAMVVGGWAIEE